MRNFFTILFCCLFTSAVFGVKESPLSANLGFDVLSRSMSSYKGFGDNIVKKNYQQGNFYGGLRFNDLFGVELGYQRTLSANRRLALIGDSSYFGEILQGISPDHYVSYSRASIKGPYGNLVALLPISEEYRLKFIASVGVAKLRSRIQSRIDYVDGVTGAVDAQFFDIVFSKKAWVPKLALGLQHMINDNCGVRTLLGWEKTSKFSRVQGINSGSVALPSPVFSSLQNSTTMGLGLFYNFF